MTPSTLPAIGPDSPDRAILEAFEQVRAHRIWTHTEFKAHAEGENDPAIEAEFNEREKAQIELEEIIHRSEAKTIPGVVAQLQLLLAGLDDNVWFHERLWLGGLTAVNRHRGALDGHATIVLDRALGLIRMDWERALAEYERASHDFNLILIGKGAVEEEEFRQRREGEPSDFVAQMTEYFDEATDSLTDCEQVDRLVRTLTPDADALDLKAAIILKERANDAVGWLARDARFLIAAMPFAEGGN